MLKKWILISALFANLFSPSLFAEDSDECRMPFDEHHKEVWLVSCTLSSNNVQQLGQYLQTNPSIDGLMLLFVDFDKKVGTELAQLLSENQTLDSLYFNNTTLGSAELATIANNNNIKQLALFGNEVDDSGIAALANNHSITDLYAGERSVSMPAMFQFLDNHSLRSFGLSDMIMTNEQLDELVHKHAHFNGLLLSGLGITNLQPLQDLDKITGLAIHYIDISDADAKAIGALHQLKYIDLDHTNISANGANQFSSLEHLTMFYADAGLVGIGDEGVQFIKHLPNLSSVFLQNQNITDIGARIVSENTHLTDIELIGNQISDDGATAISQNSNLKTVVLNANHIGDKGAAAFANHRSLGSLSLAYNRIGDSGGMALANQANLYGLNLSNNLLTDLTAYAFAARTTDLDYLLIIGNPFSKNGYAAMKDNPHIKYLFAGYIDDIEDQPQQTAEMDHLQKYIRMNKP